VRLWEFGGRANIKVNDFKEIKPEFQEFVRKVLISKLKTMLRALNEDLNRFPGIIEAMVGSQPYRINNNSNIQTQLNNPVEVKYGN